MAEGGGSVSELYPLGAGNCSDSALSVKPLMPHSQSAVNIPVSPTKTPEGPKEMCQEGLKGAAVENPVVQAAPPCPTSERHDGSQFSEPVQLVAAQSVSGSSPEHGVSPRTAGRPDSIAEPCTSLRLCGDEVTVTDDSPHPCAGGGALQTLQPASLPVQRSHSDTLAALRQAPPPQPPRQGKACMLSYYGGDCGVQEGQGQSVLACQQAMHLQHCNMVNPTYRGGNSSGGSVQQPHICVPRSGTEDVRGEGQHHHHHHHHQQQCEEPLCYGSYVYQGNPEDTFTAYCHPQPIPAAAQLMPGIVDLQTECRFQRAVPPHLAANLLALPRLMSSVSETGLDAKRLLGCCDLGCSWTSALPPGVGQPSQPPAWGEGRRAGLVSPGTTATTREVATMTAHRELRDVGVQTGQTMSETAPLHPPPHVFPQVCLVEENGSGGPGERSRTVEGGEGHGAGKGGAPKSPVKEVKWDAEGMTWEVYGASVDPEELGLAIQRHLELQIKETASRAAKVSRQGTTTSRQSGSKGCRKKKGRMMGSIRTPACCVRTTTTVD